MQLSSLHDLFQDQLKDLYSAENQLVKALPKIAKKAESESLRNALQMHLEETREHVERLNQIADELGAKLGGKKCKAMEGLIEECNELMKEDGEPEVMDAAIVAAAQRVEHYEIASYGTAVVIAQQLGAKKISELLKKTLGEEEAADEKLTEVCEGDLYPALQGPNGTPSGSQSMN